MSLNDVDKTSNDRTVPSPNSPDPQRAGRMAHGTTSFNPVTSGTNSKTSAAGFGTLRVVWQDDDLVDVPSGSGGVTKTYVHNLNTIPFIFAAGLQVYDFQNHFVVAINNNFDTSAGIVINNFDLNSFEVFYSDLDIGPGFDTTYQIVYKAALFL